MSDVDPTVSFVLAVAALCVSLGGLTISLLTYLRGRAPQPKWNVTWTLGADVPDCEVLSNAGVLRAQNLGKGVARDVVLRVVKVDGRRIDDVVDTRENIEFKHAIGAWFTFEQPRRGYERSTVTLRRESTGGLVSNPAYLVGSSAKVELAWRSEPHLHRQRRRVLKYIHKP